MRESFFSAQNGKDGVDIALKEIPDLILMDAMMPIMDGFEATRILKDDSRTERIPILMITALQQKDEKIRAFGVWRDRFYIKAI